MTEHGRRSLDDELEEYAAKYPHLRQHLEEQFEKHNEYPMFVEEADSEYESHRPNIIYPAEEPIFVHIHGDKGITTNYMALEPDLETEEEKALYEKVRQKLLHKSVNRPAPTDRDEFEDHIDALLDDTVTITDSGITGGNGPNLGLGIFDRSIGVTQSQYDKLRYRLQRDIVGLGPLEPMMSDPANEDIHVIGRSETYTDHGVYSLIPTDIHFGTKQEFDNWLRNLGERMDTPMNDADPIIDSTMPDGSRINVIYSDDVSVKGSSLTIRQSGEDPLSMFQITKWGTLSPELAAYLWLCLENEQTVFVVGETASGKTTTLNASFTFIPRDAKIYTAEDTAEVNPPHSTWQQLLTREGSGDDDSDISMFDLVAASLRSRPDYIIVGEVRGAEAKMAFQAAQTGHPVMLTFHASGIKSMIQRFTSPPIDVPEPFMNNCDVALFQNRVKQGGDVLRRVTSVQEIEGYSKEAGGVITRQAFTWDPSDDETVFTGRNNSHVLENRIAELLGYSDTRKIYDELDRRTEIINRLIDNDVMHHTDVNRAVETFQRDGVEGLRNEFGIDIAGLTTDRNV